MARTIPWHRTIGAKLGTILLVLLSMTLLSAVGSYYVLSSIQADAAWVNLSAGNRWRYYNLLYLSNRLADEPTDQGRSRLRSQIETDVAELDRRNDLLRRGDPAQGIRAPTDPVTLEGIRDRHEHWNTVIKPILMDGMTRKVTREEMKGELDRLEGLIIDQVGRVNRGIEQAQQAQAETIRRAQILQGAYVGATLVALGIAYAIARGITGRVRSLAATADRIAGGEHTLAAVVSGRDEVATLGEAFDTMTSNLRQALEAEKKRRARNEKLLATVREAVARLASAGAEILASTAQQAAGAREQAAAVAETVTTVDQIAQTASQAAQRARGVGDAVQRTLDVGQEGRRAIDDSIAALNRLKERVEATAEGILMLAEQAQAIGEIIATVNDIAEQTNILALNAAIEASRAGEHGRGFAVVAGEVKALADQSKKATTQVRQILGEIQKATHTAVLSTEEVTKGVAAAIQAEGQSGRTVNALADTLNDAAQASAQIVASAGQQATGMSQISLAMKSLDQAAQQNLAATRQVDQAAQNLNALGTELSGLTAD